MRGHALDGVGTSREEERARHLLLLGLVKQVLSLVVSQHRWHASHLFVDRMPAALVASPLFPALARALDEHLGALP